MSKRRKLYHAFLRPSGPRGCIQRMEWLGWLPRRKKAYWSHATHSAASLQLRRGRSFENSMASRLVELPLAPTPAHGRKKHFGPKFGHMAFLTKKQPCRRDTAPSGSTARITLLNKAGMRGGENEAGGQSRDRTDDTRIFSLTRPPSICYTIPIANSARTEASAEQKTFIFLRHFAYLRPQACSCPSL